MVKPGREPSAADWLVGGGELGEIIRSKDWSSTPLGPVESWPQSLRSAVSILLPSKAQICLFWGSELVAIYNDAYRPTLGLKHPSALGLPAREVWSEIWDTLRPLLQSVLDTGEAFWASDYPFFLERHGYPEETYFDISYDPVRDETGRVGGVFCIVGETTGRVVGERRLRALRDLGRIASDARTVDEVFRQAASMLERNAHDIAFSGLFDKAGRPVAACRLDALEDWPLGEALARGELALGGGELRPFGTLSGGAWPEPATTALVLPLAVPNQAPYGFLVAGVSPRRALDDDYRDFLRLVAASVASSLAAAHALEEQRARAEALAEIDRAKTTFFSNVSHEFRTPLTLMLGPLEDLLGEETLPPGHLERLEVVHRNSRRLLKLVNTLLDFSRLEAGRADASYEPVDLARFTAELASNFTSACDKAGLRLRIDCQPIQEPVWVDPIMWEKIVLNLLSNALKFTFDGEIELRLVETDEGVELRVRDTGIGIAEHEIPRLFERFHRIEGARARTHEGSGIGLALVQELVRLHGGEIRASSAPGKGSTFVVTLRPGAGHLPQDRVSRGRPAGDMQAALYVEDALSWMRGAPPPAAAPEPEVAGAAERAHILVVDDNADMREYLARLLRQRWKVSTVEDGTAALDVLAAQELDLVISDVMMPNLDGFGLLKAIKQNPAMAETPVILLSARAGEESRIDGLDAGADDYVVKPFTAAQLLAQVNSQLTLRRIRRESARERERLLAREQEAKREAENASRAKDEFLAMLGHELRNPLSPIVTVLQIMRLRGLQSAELDILDRQVGHLTRLVDDLLDVSRITRGKIELRKQRMEVAEAVLRAVEVAGPVLAQRSQRVDVQEVPRSGLEVEADSERLAQIFSNLLTNAAKYSDPGSLVTLRAERAGGTGGWIRVSVKDEGAGISPDMIDRIFDLFVQQPQTLARSEGGLGLGLGIVRNLTEMHGGKVAVRSDGPGKGSEFLVELPAAPAAVPAEDAAPRTDEQAPGRGPRRILIVDDNLDAAATLSGLLRHLGHVVEIAHDGAAALRKAGDFAPEVALVDIGLPVMDGYELAQRLRQERGSAAPMQIVAVTGYGQETDRQRSTTAGFDHHLVKPVDLATLEQLLAGPREQQPG